MPPTKQIFPIVPAGNLKPLVLRAVSGQAASAKAARRPMVPAHLPGLGNHAPHPVSRHTQS